MRDRPLGRLALLVLVLVGALLVARTCGSSEGAISQQEAVELAIEAAPFTPCDARLCVQVRNVPQGIPPRRYWLVGLAEELDDEGRPTRAVNFLVDAETGDVIRA